MHALRQGTFLAQLHIKNGIDIEVIDARPSDAIALAIRSEVPIRVDHAVFNEAAIVIPLSETKGRDHKPSLSDKVKAITEEAELRFDLEEDLRDAVSREDYEQAAKIRDRLHTLTNH